MPQFPIHTIESAPPASRPFLEGLQQEIGFIPNLAATMAGSATLIEAFTSLRRIAGRGELTPLERETVSLVVSFENDCTYCMAAHSMFAMKAGIAAPALEALRAGTIPPDARLGALAAFVRQLVTSRGHASAEAQEALLRAGFTPAQLLESIAVIAFTTIANYAHNVSGCAVDGAFQAQAWEGVPVTA
jgi:uncharacterized peroxidase-related enzyme